MWRILIASIALLPLLGCSKRNLGGVVAGKITYKGQPVNGASLRLYPDSGEGAEILVPVQQDGTFSTSNSSPGKYKIVVEAPPPPPEASRMPAIPKGMDPAKAEEMKQKHQQVQGQQTPTIRYANKYRDMASTDLTCTIREGEQPLTLELKD